MAWLQTMHAELIAEMSSPEAFATASRGWLTGTLPKVFPELYEGLRTRPVVRDKPRPKAALDLPWGQPGHVLGTLMTYRKHPAFGGSEVLYSDQSWKRLLDGLASYPFAVTVTISALNDQGFPAHQGYALVKVRRDLYAPSWVSFTFSADKQDTGWPESAEIQDRWAGFVREQAASVGACGGSMTDDIGPGQPALQRTTENFSAKIGDSRRVLRGYSWVTILAAELAERLGRAKALDKTGAFYDVSTLPNGAVWLRATPTINEFTGEKIRRVFEVLAPVLVTGVARDRHSEGFRIIEGVDAADYR